MPNIRLATAAFLLATASAFASSAPAAPPPQGLAVTVLTGELEIEIDGKKTDYTGDSLPSGLVIPPGARVRVLSGSAVLTGTGLALQVGEGADFGYAGAPGSAHVSLAADSTNVKLEIDGKVATLGAQNEVDISITDRTTSLTARQGDISVVDASGRESTLAPGETFLAKANAPASTTTPPQASEPMLDLPLTSNQDSNSVSPSAPGCRRGNPHCH